MDPDDIIITSGKLSLSQISVYQIDNPKKGAWTLVVSGGNGTTYGFKKCYLARKLWNLLPESDRTIRTFEAFKNSTKKIDLLGLLT